jgi:FAR-17a/AIG1-like protein
MTKRSMLIALRLFFGVLTLVTVGKQFAVQVQMGFSVINFFSFFTNLSNLFAAIVLIFGAFQLMTHRQPSAFTDLIRGMAVVNMVVVGIVFSVLLRDVDMGYLLPWVNTVLHYIMPIAVVLEWLLQPPKTKLGVKQLLLCQVFPLLYLVYVLVRGAIVGWYPYPFLNPANVGGYGGVAAYVIGIMVVFVVAAGSLFTLGNKLRDQPWILSK